MITVVFLGLIIYERLNKTKLGPHSILAQSSYLQRAFWSGPRFSTKLPKAQVED